MQKSPEAIKSSEEQTRLLLLAVKALPNVQEADVVPRLSKGSEIIRDTIQFKTRAGERFMLRVRRAG